LWIEGIISMIGVDRKWKGDLDVRPAAEVCRGSDVFGCWSAAGFGATFLSDLTIDDHATEEIIGMLGQSSLPVAASSGTNTIVGDPENMPGTASMREVPGRGIDQGRQGSGAV
jgi:hypothetical protein